MFLEITMVILCIALFFSLIRLIIGPTIWDRILSLNLINAKIVLVITVYGIYKNNPMLLDISLTFAIIGFLGSILFSRFILEGGRQK
jgi:multicomponent Na+:H+ antiporter subunit F